MKQAQELQKKLRQKQEELASKEFEASSGGGMVTAKINGKGELMAIKLDPEVVNKDDVEMLQDLVIVAVNEALRRVSEAQSDEMSGMMGGLGLKLPGM
jgi:DNA-binding YbaB/EbfC family protein